MPFDVRFVDIRDPDNIKDEDFRRASPMGKVPAMMEKFGKWEVSRATFGWGNFDEMVRVLEQGVKKGPWVLGDQFTAADALLGSSTYFMRVFGLLPKSEVLNGYVDRCLERPAYQAALARNDGL